MIVCDTHALIFDALAPEKLGRGASQAISRGEAAGTLSCAGISLWEIVMLIGKGRVRVESTPREFLETLLSARNIRVLPIDPDIASLAGSSTFTHGDPADRLIAATAIVHQAPLVTRDSALGNLPDLVTIW